MAFQKYPFEINNKTFVISFILYLSIAYKPILKTNYSMALIYNSNKPKVSPHNHKKSHIYNNIIKSSCSLALILSLLMLKNDLMP